MKKRWLVALMTILCLVSLPLSATLASDTTTTFSYCIGASGVWTDTNDLNAAIGEWNASSGNMELRLNRDWTFDQDASIWLDNGRLLTIDGHGGTIHRGNSQDAFFEVLNGSSLTLKNVTLDGGAVWEGDTPSTRTNTGVQSNDPLIWVYDGAVLTLEAGAILQNNDLSGGGAAISGWAEGPAASVILKSGSVIRANSASESGGAVGIFGANVELQGGTIENNLTKRNGGAVYVGQGTFTLSAGKITGNEADIGGGVFVETDEFILSGGEISGNKAAAGGGVFVNDGIMKISGPNSVNVTGNTAGTDISNVYLKNPIQVNGWSGAGAIGVSTEPLPEEGAPVTFMTGLDSENFSISGLTSDNPDYQIGLGSNEAFLEVPAPDSTMYDIAVTAGGNGTAVADVTQATPGTKVFITVQPKLTFYVADLECSPADLDLTFEEYINNDELGLEPAAIYSFEMPECDVKITAKLERYQMRELTFAYHEGGWVEADFPGKGPDSTTETGYKPDAGVVVTLTPVPKAGYHFVGYEVLSENVNIVNNQFTMPDQVVVIQPLFEADPKPIAPEDTTKVTVDEGIATVPEALKKMDHLNTTAKIETALTTEILATEGFVEAEAAVYDVKLEVSLDGGKTWQEATEENFPPEGLTITLPYPEGTSQHGFDFAVVHMFTHGEKAGQTETPPVTKTAKGLRVTFTSLSPVAVAWKESPVNVPKTGDNAAPVLWLALALGSLAVLSTAVVQRKRRNG